ncbi:MAG: hypothetical protein KatS3mg119_0614 [Rhodothalassiaceae bacterium]|nr:MAG: hypothetical protein KatS3mg119_0614 [Rhodothalassiaceae bacterium]
MRAPDGRVVADIHEKLPGRGAWVHVDRAALERALESGLLARALAGSWRERVPREAIDADLVARIDGGLRERVLSRLGLLRAGGRLVLGADAVEAALAGGKATVLVLASDAGPNTRARITARARAAGLPVVDLFTRAELALALGRENVVQAAATAPVGPRFARELGRLSLWLNAGGDDGPCRAAAKPRRRHVAEGGALRVAG